MLEALGRAGFVFGILLLVVLAFSLASIATENSSGGILMIPVSILVGFPLPALLAVTSAFWLLATLVWATRYVLCLLRRHD